MKFEELAEKFMEWAEANKSPKTISCYKSSVKKLMPLYWGKALKDIKRLDTKPKGLTILDMRVLKRMLFLAKDWDFIERVPPIHVPPEKQRTRFLSAEEMDDLIHECYDSDLLMLLRVAMGTGLRKSNLLSLKWSQIDFTNHLIKVVQKGARELWVPFNPELDVHLLKYKATLNAKPENLLFPLGKNYGFRLQRLCQRLGIKDVTFHTLRHTYASWLAMNGADLITISQLLGHRNIQTTARYTHISTEAKREAIRGLPSVLTQ